MVFNPSFPPFNLMSTAIRSVSQLALLGDCIPFLPLAIRGIRAPKAVRAMVVFIKSLRFMTAGTLAVS